jgi:hypothetical protein
MAKRLRLLYPLLFAGFPVLSPVERNLGESTMADLLNRCVNRFLLGLVGVPL